MRLLFFISLFISMNFSAQSEDSQFFTAKSQYDFKQTVGRLKKNFKANNIAIFAEIDHAKAAKKSQENLLPATVLVVGNPKVGTHLMQENPKTAIELPLKVLVYEENGVVWVRYKFVSLLVSEYKLEKTEQVTHKIDTAMGKIIAQSVMK
jgi:periplasmic protein